MTVIMGPIHCKDFICPNCGMESEQIVTCPECGMEGCVEDCITGGKGCMCPDCEENLEK